MKFGFKNLVISHFDLFLRTYFVQYIKHCRYLLHFNTKQSESLHFFIIIRYQNESTD